MKWLSPLVCVVVASVAAAQTSAPSSAPAIDSALWQEMQQVDARAANVRSLRGDFRQEKFTPLMKKPLVSTGTIVAAGSTAVWTTQSPEPTRMLVSDHEIQIFYPQQATEEIYPIEGKLGTLASSPLPRLDTLRQFFTFAKISPQELDSKADDDTALALTLAPIDDQLRQHVQQIRVLLERKTGLVKVAETTDPDGQRTVLAFDHVQLDAKLNPDDMKLNVPSGTHVEHPLAGMDGGDGGSSSGGMAH